MIADTKTKLTTTLDKELMAWIDENIDAKRFATKAHAIEYALAKLKADSDGSAPLCAPYELNEKGEPCFPFLNMSTRLIPDYPPVEGPTELPGWNLFRMADGPLRDAGIDFIYLYHKIVGDVKLEIMTDPSQCILRVELIPISDEGILHSEPAEWGEYDVRRREWRSWTTVGVERGIYQLDHFAIALVRLAERLNKIGKPKKAEAAGSV